MRCWPETHFRRIVYTQSSDSFSMGEFIAGSMTVATSAHDWCLLFILGLKTTFWFLPENSLDTLRFLVLWYWKYIYVENELFSFATMMELALRVVETVVIVHIEALTRKKSRKKSRQNRGKLYEKCEKNVWKAVEICIFPLMNFLGDEYPPPPNTSAQQKKVVYTVLKYRRNDAVLPLLLFSCYK